MAKSIHQPAAQQTKAHAPLAITKSLAVDAFPVKSSASSQYATVNKAKVRTSVRKITTKQTFVRNAQTKKMNDTTPMKTRKKPNPALNPCVVRPTDASCPAGANDEKAAKDGLRVPPRDKKNAPNVQNTTDGKVFPSTNSRSPVVNWSRPPKKKNCGIPFAALLEAPRHCIRSHDKGVKASRNPTRPIGVGFPNVLLSWPLTSVLGARYSFSNNSADIETAPVVLASCSVAPISS